MFLGFWEHIFPNTLLGWISTIFSSLAILIFIISSSFKSKKNMLFIQVVGHVLLAIGEFISNAWASIVQEIISITRNGLVYFSKNTKIVNYVLIILGVAVGLYCGIMGKNTFTPWKGIDPAKWYGYLPIIANLEYSIVVCDNRLDAKWLKLSFSISSLLWALSFMLQGSGLFLSGMLNAILGCVAAAAFVKMCIKDKEESSSLSSN